jgi:hypothetical protein
MDLRDEYTPFHEDIYRISTGTLIQLPNATHRLKNTQNNRKYLINIKKTLLFDPHLIVDNSLVQEYYALSGRVIRPSE